MACMVRETQTLGGRMKDDNDDDTGRVEFYAFLFIGFVFVLGMVAGAVLGRVL